MGKKIERVVDRGVFVEVRTGATKANPQGVVLYGRLYGFSAYLSADQLNITGVDKIDWDAVQFDETGGDYASGTFTPRIKGYYGFSAGVRWFNINATDLRSLFLFKAGSVYREDLRDDSTQSQNLSGIVFANGTTDTFEIYANNAAINTADIDAKGTSNGDRSWFEMWLLNAA